MVPTNISQIPRVKYIKFVLSKGSDVVVTEAEAKEILKAEAQLIPIRDENGQWTGETINKSHIIKTEIDKAKTAEVYRNKIKECIEVQEKIEEEAERKRKLAMTADEREAEERAEIERKQKIKDMFSNLRNKLTLN